MSECVLTFHFLTDQKCETSCIRACRCGFPCPDQVHMSAADKLPSVHTSCCLYIASCPGGLGISRRKSDVRMRSDIPFFDEPVM
jgi:hypothetical protein